jgi:hypothetical protein
MRIEHSPYALEAPRRANKRKMAWGSAQTFERARFGQGNPRKAKPNPLIVLGGFWLGFAGFG